MGVRALRPWTTQEFERYLASSRAESTLQRSYGAHAAGSITPDFSSGAMRRETSRHSLL